MTLKHRQHSTKRSRGRGWPYAVACANGQRWCAVRRKVYVRKPNKRSNQPMAGALFSAPAVSHQSLRRQATFWQCGVLLKLEISDWNQRPQVSIHSFWSLPRAFYALFNRVGFLSQSAGYSPMSRSGVLRLDRLRLRIGLVIYGSLETISGGYLYDRKLVEHLQAQGHTVQLVSLPWRNYPRHLGDNLSKSLF